jgi:hypothetical protein
MNKAFDSGKYDMMFCPDCSGSGRSFDRDHGVIVCVTCGGFGLIREMDIAPQIALFPEGAHEFSRC